MGVEVGVGVEVEGVGEEEYKKVREHMIKSNSHVRDDWKITKPLQLGARHVSFSFIWNISQEMRIGI